MTLPLVGPLLDNKILILILIVLKPNNIFMLDIAPPLSGSFLKLVPTFQSHEVRCGQLYGEERMKHLGVMKYAVDNFMEKRGRNGGVGWD
jgi:hypothetical protein